MDVAEGMAGVPSESSERSLMLLFYWYSYVMYTIASASESNFLNWSSGVLIRYLLTVACVLYRVGGILLDGENRTKNFFRLMI